MSNRMLDAKMSWPVEPKGISKERTWMMQKLLIFLLLTTSFLGACASNVPISESELCRGSLDARDELMITIDTAPANVRIAGANLVSKIDAGCKDVE